MSNIQMLKSCLPSPPLKHLAEVNSTSACDVLVRTERTGWVERACALRTTPSIGAAGKAQRSRERGGERRRTVTKRKGKTRWTRTSPAVEVGAVPRCRVGWPSSPEALQLRYVGEQEDWNVREWRKSPEFINCAALSGFKDNPDTENWRMALM